ncbi:MAG: O-antigen ligase family protein [Pirellulaceae bacterium]|nr:O-antigen ligase family protein [Pirellulaceae bacterium]
MSLTAIVWLLLFVLFTGLAFRRPVWGVVLYMLTFFAAPAFWWWGKTGMLAGPRWTLLASLLLLVVVILHFGKEQLPPCRASRLVTLIVLAFVLNATFVHYLLAPSLAISNWAYTLLLKFVLLFFVMRSAIKNRSDFGIVLVAILLGCSYVGYEATINSRGAMAAGRLEGMGVPGAKDANYLASLCVTTLPLVGSLFFIGRIKTKIMSVICMPFIVNLILLCNSRSSFLSLIVAAPTFVIFSTGRMKRLAIYALCLGGLCFFMLLGDSTIITRFKTTFASAEDRDGSASGRIEYWKAGIRIIKDYPLGNGGDAFQKIFGPRYLGIDSEKSVHNGYINDACEWGLQGLALKLMMIGIPFFTLCRKMWANTDSDKFQFCGVALIASCTALSINTVFGEFLSSEWTYWWVALACAFLKIEGSTDLTRFEEGEEEIRVRATDFESVPTL